MSDSRERMIPRLLRAVMSVTPPPETYVLVSSGGAA